MHTTDQDLHNYAHQGSSEAFRRIVDRYVGAVHLRRCVCFGKGSLWPRRSSCCWRYCASILCMVSAC